MKLNLEKSFLNETDLEGSPYSQLLIKFSNGKYGYPDWKTLSIRELDLIDVPINPDELYRIERQNMILKDYELIAICMILDIDYNDLIKVIKKKK